MSISPLVEPESLASPNLEASDTAFENTQDLPPLHHYEQGSLQESLVKTKLYKEYIPIAHSSAETIMREELWTEDIQAEDLPPTWRAKLTAAGWDPSQHLSHCVVKHYLQAESLRTGVAKNMHETGTGFIKTLPHLVWSIIHAKTGRIRINQSPTSMFLSWERPLGTFIPESADDQVNKETTDKWLKGGVVSTGGFQGTVQPAPGAWMTLISDIEISSR